MGCIDWINVVQDGDRWRALENAVVNFRVAQNAAYFVTS